MQNSKQFTVNSLQKIPGISRFSVNGKLSTVNCSQGFTLLEVILYVALAALILYAVSVLYTAVIVNQAASIARMSVESTAAETLYVLTDAIRNAESVDSPEEQDATDILVLPIPAVGAGSKTFYLSDGILEVQEGENDPVPLTSPDVVISNMLFENRSDEAASDSVRIGFTAEYSRSVGTVETSFVQTYYGSATTK